MPQLEKPRHSNEDPMQPKINKFIKKKKKEKKIGVQTKTCKRMFIATPFTVVKRWKQPTVYQLINS